jgi:ATP-dependent DNA helicase RecG
MNSISRPAAATPRSQGRTAATAASEAPSPVLTRPVAEVLGLRPRIRALLERLGIVTVHDLLRHFPHRYEDLRSALPIAQLRAAPQGEEVNAMGEVVRVEHVRLRRPVRSKITAILRDGSGELQAVWFGRPYVASQLHPGLRVFVRGRLSLSLAGPSINVTRYRIVKPGEPYRGDLLPVYPQTAGLTSYDLGRLVRAALRAVSQAPDRPGLELLPEPVRRQEGFVEAWQALQWIHHPATPEQASRARRRLVFEEFFLLAMEASRRRAQRSRQAAPDFSILRTPHVVEACEETLKRALPFVLTGAQRRVIDEIREDLCRPSPMNRLLQGDVGSGKTAVAAAAIVMAAAAGYQSAFMAPTEVLAAQQFARLLDMLAPAGLRGALLVGSLRRSTRDAIVRQLRAGDLNLVVGTHAILTEDVGFARLGLAVIDEQHRFGVMQRAALRTKSGPTAPHTLIMTATPIPRTLAQTIYADLDVSLIDELPPGRRPVKTYVRDEAAKPKVFAFLRQQVEQGRQAFVICPAIDESERALHSAVDQARVLRETAFAGLPVGLLHGRMTGRQKDEVMTLFHAGYTKILIATTVVEVGVDVPNASVMLVLDAHTFWLAQLHQLRGRVGRSTQQAYCILIAPGGEEVERLQVMARTNDGFVIAEEDLRLRGSGDLAGTRQHGGAQFRLAHLVRDFPVFVQAKRVAEQVIARDPDLRLPEHETLARYLDARDPAAALVVSS